MTGVQTCALPISSGIDTALASHQLLAADPKLRLSAAQQLQNSAKPAQLNFLDQQLVDETDSDVHTALSLALANMQLVDPDPAVRLAAVRLLGEYQGEAARPGPHARRAGRHRPPPSVR